MTHVLVVLISLIGSFSKSECLDVISTNNQTAISLMVKKMETVTDSDDKLAYLGALKMKNASYLKTPKEKMAMFKSGRLLLESAIKKDKENVEYRFLRFIVQEHVPNFLKYNLNLKEDAAFIKAHYSQLSGALQTAVKKYASKSDLLTL